MRKNISRYQVRKIVLRENLSIQKSALLKERRKIIARNNLLNKIKKYQRYNSRRQLNEFDMSGILDMGKKYLGDALGAGSDSIKDFLIEKVLGHFGIDESNSFYPVLENALENLDFSNLSGIFTGNFDKEKIVDDLVEGLIEALVEFGIGEMAEKTKDIPALKDIIPSKDELTKAIDLEDIADKVSDFLGPKIMPMIDKMLDGFSISSLFGGGKKSDSDAGGIDANSIKDKLEALNEIYSGALKRSYQKINRYNRKIKLIESRL